MKKNRIIALSGIILVVCITLLCLFCCKGKKDVYCTAIPQDATVLVRLDARSFLRKHDIDLTPLKSLVGKDMAEAAEHTGIDFSQPVYAFLLPSGKTGLCAKVSDAADLRALVEKFGPGMNIQMSEKDGYTWIQQYGHVAAFDNDRLVALMDAGHSGRQQLTEMLLQTEDKSILSTGIFDLVTSCGKPLALATSTQALPSGQRAQMAQALDVDVKDFEADVLLALDFDKDKALLTFDLTPRSSELKDDLKDGVENVLPIQGKFFTTGVANPFALVAFGLNGEELYDEVIEESGLQMFLGNLDLRKAFNSLHGDVCIQAATPDTKGLLLQAQVRDNSIMDIIEPAVKLLGGGTQAMRVGTEQYCLSNGSMPVFLGVKGHDLFYVATGTDVAAQAGQDVETWTERLASDAKGNYFYATADASAIVSLLGQQKMLPALLMGRLSQFDRLTLKVSSPTHAELSLTVRDGKDFVETVFK